LKVETQNTDDDDDVTVDARTYVRVAPCPETEGLVSVPQDGGLGDHGGDDVGVHVGRRPAVLEVALAVLLRVAAHADGRAAVRDALHAQI
jgi:hypothetical protein